MADGIGRAEVQVTWRSHIEVFDVQHGDLEMPRTGLSEWQGRVGGGLSAPTGVGRGRLLPSSPRPALYPLNSFVSGTSTCCSTIRS